MAPSSLDEAAVSSGGQRSLGGVSRSTSRTRILLVNPCRHHDLGRTEFHPETEWRNGPYSLLLLGAVLKQDGHRVELCDMQRDLIASRGDLGACLKALREQVLAFRPDLIAISFFSVHFLEVGQAVAAVREACDGWSTRPLLVAGGIHASVEPETTVTQLGFDHAFIGEGELGLRRLANGESPDSIPGFFGRSSERQTRGDEVQELDALPFPDWGLCDHRFYAHPTSARLKIGKLSSLDVLLARGCVHRCRFCAYGCISSVRHHSAEYVTAQMEKLHRDFGIDACYIHDSSIGTHRRLLREFCELLIRKGTPSRLRWMANMRADQVDEDLLKLMQRAGCAYLFYGFESGSQRVLDDMGKRTLVADNYRAARLHNQLGFPYNASLIFNYPGETEEDVHQSLQLVRDTLPPSVGVNWYVPLPGSADYEALRRSGRIRVRDPEEWRRVGEVNLGEVYSAIEPERCRALYHQAVAVAEDAMRRAAEIWSPAAAPGEAERPAPAARQHDEKERSTVSTSQPGSWQGAPRETPPTALPGAQRSQRAELGPRRDVERPAPRPASVEPSFQDRLRDKWREIPCTRQDRLFSAQLLAWSDDELLSYWHECKRQTCGSDVRGWYQGLYQDRFKGRRIADVGPGVGLDGIFFAQHGAQVTFVDIVEENLALLRRICALLGVEAEYYYIDDFFNYRFAQPFDAFLCVGSLINTPFDFARRQVDAMMRHLRVGGSVLMLGYPRERYLETGAADGAEFARFTDGERTPWIEWYDAAKVRELFGARFRLELSRNFGANNTEFNWFELTKTEEAGATSRPGLAPRALNIPVVRVQDLHLELGFPDPIDYPAASLAKPLTQWKMEVDDAPIFRYLYRHLRPARHLEFGTWQGTGAVYVLEECGATVWTINLPNGERRADGSEQYGHDADTDEVRAWAQRLGLPPRDQYCTDTLGFIGRHYLERRLGHRVCQIYCDSRTWDTTSYPEGFFDTILIDGGHAEEVVASDTRKALPLLRKGGVIVWHDFCPPVFGRFEPTRGVMAAIGRMWPGLEAKLSNVFWIEPSWILLGVKG